MAALGGRTPHTEEDQVQRREMATLKRHWERGMRENKSNTMEAAATEMKLS